MRGIFSHRFGAFALSLVSLATAQSAPGFEPSTAVALDASFSSINVKLGQTLLPPGMATVAV